MKDTEHALILFRFANLPWVERLLVRVVARVCTRAVCQHTSSKKMSSSRTTHLLQAVACLASLLRVIRSPVLTAQTKASVDVASFSTVSKVLTINQELSDFVGLVRTLGGLAVSNLRC